MIPVMDIKSIGITSEQWTSACFQAEARAVESEEVQSVQRLSSTTWTLGFGVQPLSDRWLGNICAHRCER